MLSTITNSMESLSILARPATARLVTHEIILVHGFKTYARKKSRAAECQRLLESWVISATEPIRDWVNVRAFAFDGAHILHNGRCALSEATMELSIGLSATGSEPSSPLFRSERGDSNGDFGRSSRAAVFIAHGIGIWVVKNLLFLWRQADNRIDPTALIFLDVPDLPPPMSPVDLLSEHAISQYLQEFSKVFRMELRPTKVEGLKDKLGAIDACFRELADARYGECEEIKEDDARQFKYSMKMWCNNIWMSPRPILKFGSSKVMMLIQEIFTPCGGGVNSRMNLQLQKLERAFGLQQNLKEAITTSVYSNVRPDHHDNDQISLEPVRAGIAPRGSEKGKGKEKAIIPCRKLSSPRTAVSVTKSPLPPISEHGEDNYSAKAGPSKFRNCSKVKIDDTDDDDNEMFYDLEDAIAQRDRAVSRNDNLAISTAACRLQLVEWHLRDELGKTHPMTLITQRELAMTNLMSGTPCGTSIEKWKTEDVLKMENEMRQAFETLEETLGPFDPETLETLAALLSVRVALVEDGFLPEIAMASTMDLLMERLADPAAQTPQALLHTLRLKYRAASTVAQIWFCGHLMLENLLEEVNSLVKDVGGGYYDGLIKLRVDILKMIGELRKRYETRRRNEEAK